MLNNKLLNSSGKLYYNVTYSVGSSGTGIKGNWYVASYSNSFSNTTTFYTKLRIASANMFIRFELRD